MEGRIKAFFLSTRPPYESYPVGYYLSSVRYSSIASTASLRPWLIKCMPKESIEVLFPAQEHRNTDTDPIFRRKANISR